MKIYVDELPKSCYDCELCGKLKPPAKRPEVECMHCNLMKKLDTVSEFCPLQQAEFNAESYCVLGDKKMTYKELYFNSMEVGKKQFKELQAYKKAWKELREFVKKEMQDDSKMAEKGDNDGYRYLEADEYIFGKMAELEPKTEGKDD